MLFSPIVSIISCFESLIFGSCLFSCATDYISEGYLRWIIFHPFLMFFVILGLYLIWLPLSAISWIIQAVLTPYGAFVLLILLIIYIGRLVATAIVFPISVSMVTKSMQKEVASKIRTKVDRCVSILEKHCKDMAHSNSNESISIAIISTIDTLKQPLLNVWLAQQQVYEITDKQRDNSFSHTSILRHYLSTAISLLESIDVSNSKPQELASHEPHSFEYDESLQLLALCDPASLPLLTSPPFISLMSSNSSISKCILSGLSKIEICTLALACLSRARWLSIWIEVIPYSGVGGENALRDITKALKISKVLFTQAKSRLWKIFREASVYKLKSTLFCQSRSHFVGTLTIDSLSDKNINTNAPLLHVASLSLGIPITVLEEVKLIIANNSTINVSTVSNETTEISGEVCEGCGKVHDAKSDGSNEEHIQLSDSTGSGSPSPPPSMRWDFVKHIAKQARKVIKSIIDIIWKFFTSQYIPEPVCGISYFRGEAELANGRQLWIPTEEDGMWVDAMFFPHLGIKTSLNGVIPTRRTRKRQLDLNTDNLDSADLSSHNLASQSSSALPEWVSDCYSGMNTNTSTVSGRRRRAGRGSTADEASVIGNDSLSVDAHKEGGINISPLRIPLIHNSVSGRVTFLGSCFRTFWTASVNFFYSIRALQPPELTETMISSQISFALDLAGTGNSPSTASSKGCVLICGPNAGLYEYSWRFSEWVDKYRRMGFDVVVYNYRGYGRSCRRFEVCLFGGLLKFERKDSTPRPLCLQRDSEAVAKWILRETLTNTLIVHGESLGGIAACHLGKLGLCEVLIADRTFDTLTSVGKHMVGAWSEPALIALTGWTGSNAKNFFSFSSYQPNTSSSTSSSLSSTSSTTTATTTISTSSITIDSLTTSTISPTGLGLSESSSSPLVFKIVAQDFDDQVIHHEASLALGVAALITSNTCSSDRIRIHEELQVCAAQLYFLLVRSMRESAHLFTNIQDGGGNVENSSPLLKMRRMEASKVFASNGQFEFENVPLAATSQASFEQQNFIKFLKKRGLNIPTTSRIAFEECTNFLFGVIPKSEFSSAVTSSQEASSLCALAERNIEQTHGDRMSGVTTNRGNTTTNSPFANALLEASNKITKKCIEYDSEVFRQGCDPSRLVGTVSMVLAGLTNGLGLRLGNVISSASLGTQGVASVQAFLSSAILWGWQLQERKGLLYDLRVQASIKISQTDGTNGSTDSGGNIQDSLLNPNSLAWVFGSKTMPYLYAAKECSLLTARRRLESMLKTISSTETTTTTTTTTTRTITQETVIGNDISVRVNSSVDILRETLDVIIKLESLRDEFSKFISGLERQICIPLAIGHNSPWSDSDIKILETFLDRISTDSL
jgi:hypothetical protein